MRISRHQQAFVPWRVSLRQFKKDHRVWRPVAKGPETYHDPDGTERHFLDGLRHRDFGPAYVGPQGTKAWYQHGQLHRLDGPAIDKGPDARFYFLNGTEYPKMRWALQVLKNEALTPTDLAGITAMIATWDGSPQELLTVIRLLEDA